MITAWPVENANTSLTDRMALQNREHTVHMAKETGSTAIVEKLNEIGVVSYW